MWCSWACACVSAVAWPAEGVSRKSKPTATAKMTTMARRIFVILKAILNRRLAGRRPCRLLVPEAVIVGG